MIRIMMLAVLLTACGGGGDSGSGKEPDPPTGDQCTPRGTSVGDPYCGSGLNKYTLFTQVADGQCGTYRRTLEQNSEQCGYSPEPPCPAKGTDLNTPYCGNPDPDAPFYEKGDPNTLYTRIANGTCGSWRRTIEENSPECVPPVEVELVKAEGDRFKPVVFSVDAPDGYAYEIVEGTIGEVTFLPDQLLIHGDGETGTGYIMIDNEEYSYNIVPEPRCGKPNSDSNTGYNPENIYDCQGYYYRGPPQGFIYYGDEDDQIVTWELGVVIFDSRVEYGRAEWFEKGSSRWEGVQADVDRMNEFYRRSGVHIRYELVEGAVGIGNWSNPPNGVLQVARTLPVDIVLGKNKTCPQTCGCAAVNTYFREEKGQPIPSASSCGPAVDLHEVGHSVGLAHGPDNYINEANGYIWPDFGHGHSTPFCGTVTDLMSYEGGRSRHLNSQQTCEEQLEGTGNYIEDPDAPAGSREYADSAYHLNRVRYDVSLVHCEEPKCLNKPEASPLEQPEEEPLIVEDKIDHFVDGREMLEKATNRMERFLREGSNTRREK